MRRDDLTKKTCERILTNNDDDHRKRTRRRTRTRGQLEEEKKRNQSSIKYPLISRKKKEIFINEIHKLFYRWFYRRSKNERIK